MLKTDKNLNNKRCNNDIQTSNKKRCNNDIQTSNNQRSEEDINIATSLVKLYNTHNYQKVTNLNITEILNKIINFKSTYDFSFGYIDQYTFILTKITTLDIQIIKIIIISNDDFNNIIFVPRTFSEPTFQRINNLMNEFNITKNQVDQDYCEVEFSDILLYLKNIFNLLQNEITGKNINFDILYDNIKYLINQAKKNNQTISDYDKVFFDNILTKICGSETLFEILIQNINSLIEFNYKTILLLNFCLINITYNLNTTIQIYQYKRLLLIVFRLFDLIIERNPFTLIYLKFLDNLIIHLNKYNIDYDKYLIKTKTEFLLNIFNTNKSIIIFYPNIL